MDAEKLKFKIELYATYWNKPPLVQLLINNKLHFKEKITATKEKPKIIEFEHQLFHKKSYNLIIDRTGKNKHDTVLENNKIIKDQLLHIKSIEIDEIDIGALIFEGVYKPNYSKEWLSQETKKSNKLPESIKNSPVLGHNGTWTFTFTSPFYMWLLENLY